MPKGASGVAVRTLAELAFTMQRDSWNEPVRSLSSAAGAADADHRPASIEPPERLERPSADVLLGVARADRRPGARGAAARRRCSAAC